MPTEIQLEKALRNAVRAHFRDPEQVESSPNALRAHAEKELGLEDGFFKNGDWKARSKGIIQDQFHKGEAGEESEGEKAKKQSQGVKRVSTSSSPQPRKKTKVSRVQDEDDDEESTALSEPPESDEESAFEEEQKKPMKKVQPKKSTNVQKEKPTEATTKTKLKKKAKSLSPISDNDDEEDDKMDDVDNGSIEEKMAPAKQPISAKKEDVADVDDTSSELSSVIDDPPPRTKSKKSSTSSKTKTDTATKSSKTSKSKSRPETSPEAEEIKRLQGWLVKCGVRKVWGKELKPYETPRAKINHLKSMLDDIGMTGRYSNEKAAQIKEARELAADIEAVQEGNERWGKTDESEDEDDSGGRRKSIGEAKGGGGGPAAGAGRRLVRGAKNYDFLSSDGEETD